MAYVIVGTSIIYRVNPETLLSRTRESRIVIARYTAFAIIRKTLVHLSSKTLTFLLSRKNHSEILRATKMAKPTEVRRIEKLLGFAK